ncbi:MAG: response regulator [Candidatus Binatia bacterium]
MDSCQPETVLHLAEQVVALRTEIERDPPFSSAAPVAVVPSGPCFLVVDSDQAWADRLLLEAAGQGVQLEVVPHLQAALESVARKVPDAMCVHLPCCNDQETWLTLLVELDGYSRCVPIIMLSEEETFAARREAVQFGGQHFLLKSLVPSQLLSRMRYVVGLSPATTTKVLFVSDQADICTTVREVLRPPRFVLQVSESAETAFVTLEEFAPDVLVLDAEHSQHETTLLCQVIRSDPRWAGLPTLFLVASTATDVIHRIFTIGADGLLLKPIVAAELVAQITDRTVRTGTILENADTDPVTGGIPQHRAMQFFDRFLPLARRYQQAFSLALIAIDDANTLRATHGFSAWKAVLHYLGRLLRSSFRVEDVIIRAGPSQFLVGGYGLSREDGVLRLAETLEVLRLEQFPAPDGTSFTVTFSGGVAQYPIDAQDYGDLYATVAQILSYAQEAGGNRVLAGDRLQSESHSSSEVDVFVVEDDPPLAKLLLHALDTRGYSTRWVDDGQEAVEILMSEAHSPRRHVVLLDIGLPSLDGLTILRQLARVGALQQTRVVMLTARAAETEAVEALELGAVDFVTKPFSMPVLMRRIRRELHK